MMADRIVFFGGEDLYLRLPTMLHLREMGYEVIGAAPVAQPRLEEAGFQVCLYGLNRAISPREDLAALRRIEELVAELSPDLVHAFDTKPAFLVPLALRKTSQVVVGRTITGMGRVFSEKGLKTAALAGIYRFLHWLARDRADFTIFQNTTDQAWFMNRNLVRPGSERLIRGSGVTSAALTGLLSESQRASVRAALGVDEGKDLFLMVSRLVRQKGVEDAIKAARRLDPKRFDLIFVGPAGVDEPDGVNPDILGGEGGNIRWVGRRDDVPSLLGAADFFLFPTKYREGVPRALLEAMAAGLPAIVTDMPGTADPVRSGKAGWIVSPGDVSALSEAMQEAIDLPASARLEMGRSGREEVSENYDVSIVNEALLGFYDELLHK